MKKLLLVIVAFGFLKNVNGQINSNPGSYNWSNTAAWSGGVVPTSTDVVNIVLNSSITLDAPLVHAADINILNLGSLNSLNPLNDLTINGADLNLIGISSGLNFAGIGSAVPVTINEGHLNSAGNYTSGDLDINCIVSFGTSSTSGDFAVLGDMTITGSEVFENQNFMSVSGAFFLAYTCGFNNNLTATFGSVENIGSFANLGTINVNGDIDNDGGISSAANNILIGGNMNNNGTTVISDSMDVQLGFNNSGTFTNNDGKVNIVGNFNNGGTLTGSLNGYYQIGQVSYNGPAGIINGDIDVCDTSLTGVYLDSDIGSVDFVTVTFCGTSYASVEEKMADSFLMYPNPATNSLTIDMTENAIASIYSMDGKLLQTSQLISGINTLSVVDLQTGFYSIVIISAKGTASEIFIKQ